MLTYTTMHTFALKSPTHPHVYHHPQILHTLQCTISTAIHTQLHKHIPTYTNMLTYSYTNTHTGSLVFEGYGLFCAYISFHFFADLCFH